VHQEIKNFDSGKSDPNQLVNTLKEATSGLSNASGHKMSAKVYDKLDGKTLDRLNHALGQLGMTQAVKGERVNWGNVLLSLRDFVKKMEDRKKDARLLRKGKKIESIEVVEFLNSTEKEFRRMVTLIKDRDADDETLVQFILELMRKMEVLGAIQEMAKTRKLSLKVDQKYFKQLLKYIKQLQQNEEIKHFIHETGSNGESGNSHLRFWKALKQFSALINEMEIFSK